MLYKSSDGDKRPNITILSQLAEQHGKDSEEVQAFMSLYAEDEEFISQARKLMSLRFSGENNDRSK